MRSLRIRALIAFCASLLAVPASAEIELSFYTGIQSAPHSRVEGTDPGNAVSGTYNFGTSWDGASFKMPPYWGARATYWRNARWGFGVDFNHAKVIADPAKQAANGFSRLEFTDGLNILTANVWRRWQNDSNNWTPYVGAGAGFAFPHVDIESAGGKVFEYQITGPAVAVAAGIKYDFNDRWGVFGEYKGTYSVNEVTLGSGGTLKTNVITNAINIGVSFSF